MAHACVAMPIIYQLLATDCGMLGAMLTLVVSMPIFTV
jgi:hypothetical protein